MAKEVTDRPINALTWDERNPSRYDVKPLDLSEWDRFNKSTADVDQQKAPPARAAESEK